MDKRRCLRRSGQFTASSVFLCLLLRLLKRDGTGVELLKPPLVSACYPPVLQLLASHRRVWITGITVCHLLEIAASGVDSTASDGRTRARSTLLRLFYGSSRLRDGPRSLGLFSGCVLFGPVRF
ncbi:unnamed protein product [Brassica rapa]|uniref:Secreted protein n=1 Tax=Brassica campestris TaxID=3711 RepID=A0A8D9GVU1_BRACM|nr:unnamed protein product [Brassica rapa]